MGLGGFHSPVFGVLEELMMMSENLMPGILSLLAPVLNYLVGLSDLVVACMPTKS